MISEIKKKCQKSYDIKSSYTYSENPSNDPTMISSERLSVSRTWEVTFN